MNVTRLVRANASALADWMSLIPHMVKAGFPHVQNGSWVTMPGSWYWRLYGIKPYYRMCIFDWTHVPPPGPSHIRVFGVPIWAAKPKKGE